jgi:hypothetical protein
VAFEEVTESARPSAEPTVKIFINYRRGDSSGDAQALYNLLAQRYGRTKVFFDRTLEPGINWRKAIKLSANDCGIFLALIGPGWATEMSRRTHARAVDPREDYVKAEIESALKRGSGVTVIPVVIGDAMPPSADALPQSLTALADTQVAGIGYEHWDDDVKRLIERIDEMALAAARVQPPQPPTRSTLARSPVTVDGAAAPIVAQPTAGHYEDVLRFMVDQGTVVPILGSRVNASDPREQSSASGHLPDAEELAADIARRFGITPVSGELAWVAQYVYVTSGRPDLYRTLQEILGAEYEPGSVHRFFADLPARAEALSLRKHYQLIITTNYDNALEQAFLDAKEPYDLVVYMASGKHAGKFLHVPYDGEPRPITEPNSYPYLPIDDYYELDRTLIVKVHGAVDGAAGIERWKENYVITEDHYIDYLSGEPISQLVPTPILEKVKDSHCLFLGYTTRDWNLRVFLRRIWSGLAATDRAKSWAVERDPNLLEKEFWSRFGVELFDAPLANYVGELDARLAAREAAAPS